ncbi:hypothetical protein L286_01290 [Sphingobium sp. HDIP04]|nr:hypothetical protein L286_12045 [Sphingobium sp. HDIP04]EQB08915.1 hypothetical protein L286_01290 [Sphingobium sp. HDIP04]
MSGRLPLVLAAVAMAILLIVDGATICLSRASVEKNGFWVEFARLCW